MLRGMRGQPRGISIFGERLIVNVSVENLGPCRKLVRVELDAASVEAAFSEITRAFIREVRLPGFRPGKAPPDMVIKQHSARIEEEVKRKLVNESSKKALKEQKLEIVGQPDIEEVQFGRNEPMIFNLTVDTVPQFELANYKGLEVKRTLANVSDEDVERALSVLQEQRAVYRDVNRPVQQGDFVVVNYTGTADGKPLTDLAPTARGITQQNKFWMEVGNQSFIPGFTDQLIGANAGERRQVTVRFPDDFVAKELAGLTGVYDVEIIHVKEKSLPALDDQFAAQFQAENLDKLREGVRRDLQNELNHKMRNETRSQVIDHLLRQVQFDLPESLVVNETRNLVYDLVRENQERGIPTEVIDKQKDQIFQHANHSAKERLKVSFILRKIAAKEGIRVTDEELTQRILYLAYQNKVKVEKFVKQLEERGGIAELHESMLNVKVLEFLELNAKIEDAPAEPTQAS